VTGGDPSGERLWDAFADVYDRFTAAVDYETWMGELEALAREHGLAGRELLDVACGSGKSFAPFLDRGYAVTGCDLSSRMLAVAERRARGRATLLQRDMRTLEPLGSFDLVLLVNDALNYLLTDSDLTATLRAVAANLAPDGLLVLDVNTTFVYRTMYASTSVIEDASALMVWRGHEQPDVPEGAQVAATLDVFVAEDDHWRRTTVTQTQRHHPAETLAAAIAAAGLDVVATRGQGFDGLHADVDPARDFKVVQLLRRA
jgi:SAM-dependent methyltransferase